MIMRMRRLQRVQQPLPLALLLTLLLLLAVDCPDLELWRIRGAQGAPKTVDWTTCAPPVGRPDVDCCTLPDLMTPGGPRVYKELDEYLRENPLPERPRVRPAAHLVARNATYLAQLNRAYQLMRELPSTDSRSLAQQTNLHCMYNSVGFAVAMQQLQHAEMAGRAADAPVPEFSVHANCCWSLQDLVAFSSLDNQSQELVDGQDFLPSVVPRFYRDPKNYPALFNAKRHPRHAPGNPDIVVDLSIEADPSTVPDDMDEVTLRRYNNERLHDYVAASTQGLEGRIRFMSYPLRSGEDPVEYILNDHTKIWTFEYQLHGAIHDWLADPASDLEDMGRLWASVNDAIFMAHHSNVDRMWAVWQSLGGKEFDDPEFLDSSFFFYDENEELVRVTVADCLDHRKLKIDWQRVDNPCASPSVATSSPDTLFRATS